MEELYQRYRAGFKGDLSETLHLSFYGEDYILDNFNSNDQIFQKMHQMIPLQKIFCKTNKV